MTLIIRRTIILTLKTKDKKNMTNLSDHLTLSLLPPLLNPWENLFQSQSLNKFSFSLNKDLDV